MPVLEAKDVPTANSTYDAMKEEWTLYHAAFRGTRALLEAGYLEKHDRESKDNYAARKKQAVSLNYSRSVIDIFLQYLFEKPGQREFGSLQDDPLFEAFLADVDLYGTNYDSFWHDVQQYAQTFGHVGLLIVKPGTEAVTRADELQAGAYPYCTYYTPLNILDWRYERETYGRPVLSAIKLRDDDGRVHYWTRESWEVWEPSKSGYALEAEGANNLGEVPFVWHLGTRGDTWPIGVSDITEVARLDVSIMRNLSQADEVIDLAAFPMLMVPRMPPGEDKQEVAVGPSAVLEFDKNQPESKPDWLRAEVLEPIDAILRFIQTKVGEIYRMTGTKTETGLGDANIPSGRALAIIFRQLNAKLAERSSTLDESELACLRIWAKWQNQSLEGVVIKRPRDFNISELLTDLQNMLTAKSLVKSETFQREMQKKAVRRILPNLKDEVSALIDDEISNAPAADLNNLLPTE